MRTILIAIAFLGIGVVPMSGAPNGSIRVEAFYDNLTGQSGGDIFDLYWYCYTPAGRFGFCQSTLPPEGTSTTIEFFDTYFGFSVPAYILGMLAFGGVLVCGGALIEIRRCWLLGATKPVEPTGISSSPSDLTTSHASGNSPGGSLHL